MKLLNLPKPVVNGFALAMKGWRRREVPKFVLRISILMMVVVDAPFGPRFSTWVWMVT